MTADGLANGLFQIGPNGHAQVLAYLVQTVSHALIQGDRPLILTYGLHVLYRALFAHSHPLSAFTYRSISTTRKPI
ncbi:hypothetical protein D3C76_1392480 [compost metagenome]